jgi:hypothetical protein
MLRQAQHEGNQWVRHPIGLILSLSKDEVGTVQEWTEPY